MLKDSEKYDPGEVSHRILIFNFPEGRLPKRLRCGHATFAIPQIFD